MIPVIQQPAVNQLATTQEVQPHALDPTIPQILPLTDALAPYTPPVQNTNNQQQEYNFDLMSMLSDLDEVDANQLVLAATQVKKSKCNECFQDSDCQEKFPETTSFHLQWMYLWLHWNTKHSYSTRTKMNKYLFQLLITLSNIYMYLCIAENMAKRIKFS